VTPVSDLYKRKEDMPIFYARPAWRLRANIGDDYWLLFEMLSLAGSYLVLFRYS
jgi:hypothetical protein